MLYQAIIALIIANFNSDYPMITSSQFNGYPIFQGQQNNYTIPANGKYVVLTAISDENQVLNPTSALNMTTNTQDYFTLIVSMFQADFYGANAQDNARKFSLLLNSPYADNFFIYNNYACSVQMVKSIVNLTGIFGRDMYLPRFAVRYALYNNPIITTPLPKFTGFANNIRWANIQT